MVAGICSRKGRRGVLPFTGAGQKARKIATCIALDPGTPFDQAATADRHLRRKGPEK